MIIDRLYEQIQAKSSICVGLDTHLSYLPKRLLDNADIATSLFNFNREIIEATADLVAVYKLQIAYYEANGLAGLEAYKRTLNYLKSNNLLAIGDIKRGDIAATAKEYAKAHLVGEFAADFITLNPYMGFDSITPYLEYVQTGDKGLFILLRTSNPGAKDIEYLQVNQQPLYYHVGDALAKLGEQYVGECGLSNIGMVVGGTHSEEALEIRDRYPNSCFLIPGYGAQGGKASDIRLYLGERQAGVVNSSRGIITAHQKTEDLGETTASFQKAIREACLKMQAELQAD